MLMLCFTDFWNRLAGRDSLPGEEEEEEEARPEDEPHLFLFFLFFL